MPREQNTSPSTTLELAIGATGDRFGRALNAVQMELERADRLWGAYCEVFWPLDATSDQQQVKIDRLQALDSKFFGYLQHTWQELLFIRVSRLIDRNPTEVVSVLALPARLRENAREVAQAVTGCRNEPLTAGEIERIAAKAEDRCRPLRAERAERIRKVRNKYLAHCDREIAEVRKGFSPK